MARLASLAISFMILIGTILAVGGAEARRPSSQLPGAPDRPPHGLYECWPGDDAASADSLA